MENIIDLAAERMLRQNLTQQASQDADAFVVGLERAGQSLANLAWALAAPVRHRDKELKEGIYELLLARLHRIAIGAIGDMNCDQEVKFQAMKRAETIAFAAFQARLLTLAAAEQDGKPTA